MADAKREGLKAAGDVIASFMRSVARTKTRRTAEAVNITYQGEDVVISAGHATGAWGWEPIQALMFDNNKRHPLFGDKGHWYHQGYYPISEDTVRLSANDATDAFTDAALSVLYKEHGFTE